MKRFLVFLTLIAAALLLANACSSEINLSVTAYAELDDFNIYDSLKPTPVRVGPVKIGKVFHNEPFSDSDLRYIFSELMKGVSSNFTTAILRLEVRDAISDKKLRDETYGVIINSSGGFDFANMDVVY